MPGRDKKDTGGQSQSGTSRKNEKANNEVDETPPAVDPKAAENKEKLDADVDSLLDEIDNVLEENAEEFVKGYVQKGGQ